MFKRDNIKGRKEEDEYRQERVVFHVTKEEKEIIKELAKSKGMDVSTLIRTELIYKKFNRFFKGV